MTSPVPTVIGASHEVSKKFWIAEHFPEDADGSKLSPDGRVIEISQVAINH